MAEKGGIAVRKVLIGLSAFVLAMVIASCSNSDGKGHDPTESQTDEAKPIQLTEYADEIGFTLTEPMEASNSVESTVRSEERRVGKEGGCQWWAEGTEGERV